MSHPLFVDFVRQIFGTEDFIPLHEPRLSGREQDYVAKAIESTFVSSVGEFVSRFEAEFARFTGASYAIATVNGTAALHAALVACEVRRDDEVLTQPLTFVATCNAISYCGARPVFVDVSSTTLSMCPRALSDFLEQYAEPGAPCRNRTTGRAIRACVPMHTFGHAAEIHEIVEICDAYGISVVEDAAESLGTHAYGSHTGRFGKLGVFSFNGNKIVTTGGGGMVVTDDAELATKLRHLTTTAKIGHPWAYEHDEVGYNYRLPNLNAALGCAQMEQLPTFLAAKRALAARYSEWCSANGICFVRAPAHSESNYWLNAIMLEDRQSRDFFLEATNASGIMTRPAWTPMHRLRMFSQCQHDGLKTAEYLADRLVNIPSSAIL